jgi:EAL domain-containing protein (putative c-di-GMP-specific phosphodiesterase class I)
MFAVDACAHRGSAAMGADVEEAWPDSNAGGQNASLCFVIDPDFGFLHEFSMSFRSMGIDTVELVSSARLAEKVDDHNPDVIFIDVSPESPFECTRALISLTECKYGGRVQLIGKCKPAFLETFCKIGNEASLRMLPPLTKPVNLSVVRNTVLDQKLKTRAVATPEFSLKTALASDFITFWYQPKINLKLRRVVGAEAFARIAHPQRGVIAPGHFLAGAVDEDVLELARRALVSTLVFSSKLVEKGINLKIAINLSVDTLVNLPIPEIVAKHRPNSDQWAGIIVEVPEAQLYNKVAAMREKFTALEKLGISLAIDNFGRGNTSFAAFRNLPFSEIKIDASFVQSCATNKSNANICRSMIEIAHIFGRQATAVGIETPAGAQEIMKWGCDIGQGYLFGKPMTEQQLVMMVMAGRSESERFCDTAAAVA